MSDTDAGPLLTIDGYQGAGGLPPHDVALWAPELDPERQVWRVRLRINGPVYQRETTIPGLDPIQALERACAFVAKLMAPKPSSGPQ